MTKPTTPKGAIVLDLLLKDRGVEEWTLRGQARHDILAIEQEAAALAVEQERERLRDAIDRLPSVVFLPQDIERIYAGETLPLVTRRALWNLLNPEIE